MKQMDVRRTTIEQKHLTEALQAKKAGLGPKEGLWGPRATRMLSKCARVALKSGSKDCSKMSGFPSLPPCCWVQYKGKLPRDCKTTRKPSRSLMLSNQVGHEGACVHNWKLTIPLHVLIDGQVTAAGNPHQSADD